MNRDFDFKEIGLTTRDKRVYEALLSKPRVSLRQIAVMTGINRGSVYESVKQLTAAGLVGSYQVNKRLHYAATEPRVIIELLKERQAKAASAEAQAAAYIRQIATAPTDEQPVTPPFARHYEGDEGVAAILRDVIATCQELVTSYRAISTNRVRNYMYQNFPNFTQRRIAEGIAVRVIAVGAGGSDDALSERKWLVANRSKGPNCYTLIYGDKTALISINDTNIVSGIVIDNAGVTQLQKELFDSLWQIL